MKSADQEKALRSPVGAYHSALAAAAYLEGLPEEQAVGLFNSYTYAKLGYFSQMERSVRQLETLYETLGFQLPQLTKPFMYTINHPVIELLFDLAAQALRRADVTAAGDAPMPDDPLADDPIWPLYPELAARAGYDSEMVFRGRRQSGRALSLQQFVGESYERYRAYGGDLVSKGVDRARFYLQRELRRTNCSIEDVRLGYRFILGRECESDDAAALQAARHEDVAELRSTLLSSFEFRNRVLPRLTGKVL